MARFDEISPLLQKFRNFKVYFIFGKVLSPLWHNLYASGQFFIGVNGHILKTIGPSGHTDPLPLSASGLNPKHTFSVVFNYCPQSWN